MNEIERKIFAAITKYEYEKLGYIGLAEKFSTINPNSDQVIDLEAQAKKMVNAFQECVNVIILKRETE